MDYAKESFHASQLNFCVILAFVSNCVVNLIRDVFVDVTGLDLVADAASKLVVLRNDELPILYAYFKNGTLVFENSTDKLEVPDVVQANSGLLLIERIALKHGLAEAHEYFHFLGALQEHHSDASFRNVEVELRGLFLVLHDLRKQVFDDRALQLRVEDGIFGIHHIVRETY